MSLFRKREETKPQVDLNAAANRTARQAAAPAPIAKVEAPPAQAVKAQDKPEEIQGSKLIVGPDVKLRGAEIADCGTLIVEGRVEAVLDSRVLHIAEQGSFSGKVGIDVAEIHGRFEGDLAARTLLVIHSTGRVSGKIRYGKIVIEEGGEVTGDVRSISSEQIATAPVSAPADEPKRAELFGLDVVARAKTAFAM